MVREMAEHPELFDELAKHAIGSSNDCAPRAAYLLSSIAEEYSDELQSFYPVLLNAAASARAGHKRDLINCLIRGKPAKEYEAQVYDLCVSAWSDVHDIPSVRFVSIKYMIDFATKYPDLRNDIALLTQDFYLDTLSPGAKRAIIKRISVFIGNDEL